MKKRLKINVLSIMFSLIVIILCLDFANLIWKLIGSPLKGIFSLSLPSSHSYIYFILFGYVGWRLVRTTGMWYEVKLFFIPPFLFGTIEPRGEKGYRIKFSIPENVYYNESFIVSLDIKQTEDIDFSEHVLPHNLTSEVNTKSLYVELDAPAFDIMESNRKIKIDSLIDGDPKIKWNILPTKSGRQSILIRLTNADSDKYEMETAVRVNKIDGLTANQIWLIGVICGFISGLIGLISIVSRLLTN